MRLKKASGFDFSICFFGFALFWAYRWMFFNTNVLDPVSYRGTLLLSYTGTFGAAIQALVVLVVILGIVYRKPVLISDKAHAVIVVVLGTIATPLIVVGGLLPGGADTALTVVGWVAREAASGVLVCLWAKFFCAATERNVSIYTSTSISMAAVIVLAISYAPKPVDTVCTTLMPVGSVALFYVARDKLGVTEQDRRETEDRIPPKPLLPGSLWRLLIAIAVFSAVFAVGLSEVTNRLAQTPQTAVSFTLAGNFLGGLIIAVIVLAMPRMSAIARVYQFSLPVMVFSLMLMAYQGYEYIHIVELTMSLGFTIFDIVSWIVLIDLAHYTKTSVLRAFLAGRFFSLFGMFIGRVFSLFALGALQKFHDAIIGVFPLAGAFILVLAASTLLHGRGLFYNEQLSDEIDQEFIEATKSTAAPDAHLQDYWRAKIDAVVRKYGLTPRESEVLALLARGRTNSFIQEELVISKHTVDTHVIHVYRKCGVHSKQEMLTLIEETEGSPQD